MRFLGKFILYLFVGILSFFFFLYLTFPYQVLKERMVNTISKETHSLVSIKKLGPSFPLGLKFEDIRVYRPGIGDVSINSLSIHVSVLSLLLGNLRLQAEGKDFSGGSLDLETHLGLSSLWSSSGKTIPSFLSLNANKFNLAPMVNYFIKLKSGEKKLNPIIKSALRDVLFVGKLSSKSSFELDEKDYLNSKGVLDLQFVDAGLELLSLPFQQFKDAQIKASLNKGSLKFAPETQLASDGLKLELSGVIKQAEMIMRSRVDLTIKIELFKELKENFAMILDLVTNKTSEGLAKIRVKGVIDAPKVDIF